MRGSGGSAGGGERRRVERRYNARVADLTLPEFRRILITSTLFVIVLALFLWMVRTVVIAAILGIVIALYLRPISGRLAEVIRTRRGAALLTILLLVVPLIVMVIYAYVELREAAAYIALNQDFIVERIDQGLRRLPFVQDDGMTDRVRRWVLVASNYGADIPAEARQVFVGFSISTTIFLFTAFYILTDGPAITAYLHGKLPPRYMELTEALETNIRGVLYGAVYATLVTQILKTVILFALFVAFDVPLAALLALLSFIIGFFPIVGSWSIYVPVAGWLFIFRESPTAALILLAAGFLGNTLFISTYLRPKLAAKKSKVLNFYWMLVGLVTGVYTFGLAGILLGPILIGMLKAIIDTVTSQTSWRMLDRDATGLTGEHTAEGASSPAVPGAHA